MAVTMFGSKKVFTCNESMCWGGVMRGAGHPERSEDGRSISIPLGIKIERVWLIRPGAVLNDDFTEQDAIAAMEDKGIEAMWVDSESDAHAMAMED